jgi:hypothetical protein
MARGFYHAHSLVGVSIAKYDPDLKNSGGGFVTREEAIAQVQSKIDIFLSLKPKTWEELANLLDYYSASGLDHSDTQTNPLVLQHLVETFYDNLN